jgi:hypothetical protein
MEDDEPHIQGKLVDLGKNKLVTLAPFGGKVLVHLREYYRDSQDGLRKPTKKGITLTIEQWNELCSSIPIINSTIEQSGGPPLSKRSLQRKPVERYDEGFENSTKLSSNNGKSQQSAYRGRFTAPHIGNHPLPATYDESYEEFEENSGFSNSTHNRVGPNTNMYTHQGYNNVLPSNKQ